MERKEQENLLAPKESSKCKTVAPIAMKNLNSKISSRSLSTWFVVILVSGNSFHILSGLSLAGDRGESMERCPTKQQRMCSVAFESVTHSVQLNVELRTKNETYERLSEKYLQVLTMSRHETKQCSINSSFLSTDCLGLLLPLLSSFLLHTFNKSASLTKTFTTQLALCLRKKSKTQNMGQNYFLLLAENK